jgi:hypothetical protein
MFDEYSCGCIVSPFQGRVRICSMHHNVVELVGNKWVIRTSGPSGKIVQRYPANGEK